MQRNPCTDGNFPSADQLVAEKERIEDILSKVEATISNGRKQPEASKAAAREALVKVEEVLDELRSNVSSCQALLREEINQTSAVGEEREDWSQYLDTQREMIDTIAAEIPNIVRRQLKCMHDEALEPLSGSDEEDEEL